MAGKDIIIMSQKELKRLPVIHNVINRQIAQAEAANILDLSIRHIRRIASEVKTHGDIAIIHKSRGRPSNRARPKELKNKILDLCRNKYQDFGPTFAAEKLFEINKFAIHPDTLRKWFIESAIEYKKRKAPKHRSWRPRKDCFGQMVQMDGSHHNWFEQRGPWCVLMGYVDDATGNFYGRFYDYEGTKPAMDSFKRYILKYGIPQSVYLDKHTTYKSPQRLSIEDELNNTRTLSQMERVFKQLAVDVIHADSPQAKGRVERGFGTHQDRLVKELRLSNINTVKQANKFLGCYYTQKHNRKFTYPANNKTNLYRPIPKHLDLNRVFSIKNKASLRNDFTIRHNNTYYQILEAIRADTITLEERLNSKLYLYHKDKQLKYKLIDKRLEKPKQPLKLRYAFGGKRFVPPQDHIYRKFKIKKCA